MQGSDAKQGYRLPHFILMATPCSRLGSESNWSKVTQSTSWLIRAVSLRVSSSLLSTTSSVARSLLYNCQLSLIKWMVCYKLLHSGIYIGSACRLAFWDSPIAAIVTNSYTSAFYHYIHSNISPKQNGTSLHTERETQTPYHHCHLTARLPCRHCTCS